MKQIVIFKKQLLEGVIHMNNNSLTLAINGETYLIHRRVFNALIKDESIPTFVIKREFAGVTTNWIAIPSSL